MINPNKQEAADLAHIAEHVEAWPKGADFIYLGPGDVIHIIEGGDSAVCKYINREQWAAARTLLGYWFPGKDVWPDTSCAVCGEEHCQYDAFPGICAEYESGTVTLELARAIYSVGVDGSPVGLQPEDEKRRADFLNFAGGLGAPGIGNRPVYCQKCYTSHSELLSCDPPPVGLVSKIPDCTMTPEEEKADGMNKDLKWLAENVTQRQGDDKHKFLSISEVAGAVYYGPPKEKSEFTREEWLAARNELGLDSPFTTPEEDEAWADAELRIDAIARDGERAADYSTESMRRTGSIGQNGNTAEHYGKQPRYQDTQGEDWIDEAARTFTAEEFRGAMRFTIGKYNRRMGKKDEMIKEIDKIRDYASRWLEVEKGR
jgi:hypothetical protein